LLSLFSVQHPELPQRNFIAKAVFNVVSGYAGIGLNILSTFFSIIDAQLDKTLRQIRKD